MWIRSAFWLGAPKPGMEQHFRDQIDGVMVSAIRALPGVRSVQALWPQQREADPPPIACQMLVHFDNREGMERMLASPERAALRPQVLELVAQFDGRLAHIDYEVTGA